MRINAHLLLYVFAQVLVSYPKETHWWTRERPPYRSPGQQLSESRWLVNHARRIEAALKHGASEPVVVEGSASLFWEQPFGSSGVLAPELIHAVAPRTRFILMVRDPADRLYSDYLYFAYRSLFNKKPSTRKYTYNPAGFHLAVEQSIAEMRKCFAALSPAACAWDQRGFRTTTQIQLGM